MALPVYSIARLTNAATGAVDSGATYGFFDLVGPIPLRQERVERIERPGVEDYALRFLGKSGPEFTLDSLGYVNTVDAADLFTATVEGLIRDPLGVAITQNGSSLYPFDVLGIERIAEPRYEIVSTTRITPGTYASVRLRWRLVGRNLPSGA